MNTQKNKPRKLLTAQPLGDRVIWKLGFCARHSRPQGRGLIILCQYPSDPCDSGIRCNASRDVPAVL